MITSRSFPQHRHLDSTWELARLSSPETAPSSQDWMPAIVPGAVQLDWARAHGLPDCNFGQNVRLYDGLEDSHWLYRTSVPPAPRGAGERLFFACAGVDYQCEVRLGGKRVLAHTGMVTPFEVDVSSAAPGTSLEVLIFPAPKKHAQPIDRTQASHVTKPAVSYGWDWHPRLIPLGLCDDARFEIRPAVHLRHVDFAYTLADDFSFADIVVTVESSDSKAAAKWRLRDPSGAVVIESASAQARLANPQLWWTHDEGKPSLYSLEVELAGGDTLQRRVGFRRVKLMMHEGAWKEPIPFPKTRNKPPVTLELNGRRVFVKGTNWVCPDMFHGRTDAATYQPLVQLARDAHFNILRCWGGAAAPKESFFDQCDELGLLVWQEFPLSCNCYPDDPAYLAVLDAESRAIVRRGRQHPCLGLWVGGNELFNPWSGMTDQGLPVRLLNRNCYELDPQTPFLPTAPLEGMGHGDYRFFNAKQDQDVMQMFQGATCTAYSEFGCPSISPVEYLKTFIPEAELWPAKPGTSWETHHGINAWEEESASWICPDILKHYFGEAGSLAELVDQSSWLQCEGYKAIFEEARRQQPRCSMALNWCFNEPWPTAANNSIVNWPAVPKPSYYAVQAACRPVLASARIPHFQWRAGDEFTAEPWLLNDSPAAQPAGELQVHAVFGERRVSLLTWSFPALAAKSNLAGPCVRIALPKDLPEVFELELTVPSQPSWASRYRLSAHTTGIRHPQAER